MRLAIHLLGPPRLARDGHPIAAPRGRKAWALLAYLVRHPRGVGRSHLAELLFENADDPLGALRWNLSELRRTLGDDQALRGDPLSLPALSVDALALLDGEWAEALQWPGLDHELLEGLSFPDSPSFEVWLATERRHLQAAAESVLREAALTHLAGGEGRPAATLAARLVQLNPLDSSHQSLWVRSLAAAGDGIAAARQVAACRELFVRELGVDPGHELEAALRTFTAAPVARPVGGRAAIQAQLDAGEAAIVAGALEAGLQCLRRAIADADAQTDPVLRARTRVALGGALVHAARGRDEEGATALHEALAIGSSAAPPIAAAACRELGYVEFLRGRNDRARLWLLRAAALADGAPAEQARIATVHGGVLSDMAHYAEATARLQDAEQLAQTHNDNRQLAYILAMRGRVSLLCGDADTAAALLDRAIALCQPAFASLLPWPQSLRAEVDLLRGDVDAAAERFEHAFALGCQLGDPCWEALSARGLGCVAMARGDTGRAVDLLLEAITRSVRLPDAYLWAKGHALDALCGLATACALPQASAWITELQTLAARCGMRELTLRAHLHRAALGDRASASAARRLADEIDNPSLVHLVTVATH
jgi:DNA-binding SARP family transcriptional activator